MVIRRAEIMVRRKSTAPKLGDTTEIHCTAVTKLITEVALMELIIASTHRMKAMATTVVPDSRRNGAGTRLTAKSQPMDQAVVTIYLIIMVESQGTTQSNRMVPVVTQITEAKETTVDGIRLVMAVTIDLTDLKAITAVITNTNISANFYKSNRSPKTKEKNAHR